MNGSNAGDDYTKNLKNQSFGKYIFPQNNGSSSSKLDNAPNNSIARKNDLDVSGRIQIQTLRLQMESTINVEARELEANHFLKGEFSHINWKFYRPLVDGVLEFLNKKFGVQLDEISVVELVPRDHTAHYPELNIIFPLRMTLEESAILEKSLDFLIAKLKRPKIQLDGDWVYEIDAGILNDVVEIADRVVSEIGGKKPPFPLSIKSAVLSRNLTCSGRLGRPEIKEEKGEPVEIAGEFDGYQASKHYFFFQIHQKNGSGKKRCTKIYYKQADFENSVKVLKHGDGQVAKITVRTITRNRKKWMTLINL